MIRSILTALFAVFFVLFVMAAASQAFGAPQNNGAMIPYVPLQFFSATGLQASNGRLCSLAAGTTNSWQATYADNALTTPNANPQVLSATGHASTNIYLQALSYKFILYNAYVGVGSNACNGVQVGSVIWTLDNVYDFGQFGVFVSINNRQYCVTGADFGAKFTNAATRLPSTGGIVDCSNLQGGQTNASDAWGGVSKPITLIAPIGIWTLGSNVTIPSTMTLIFPHGASVSKGSSTFTVNGVVIDYNGTNAPIEFGGGYSPYGSMIHVGPYGTSGGGYLTSEAIDNFSLSAGAKRTSASTWVATATDAGQVHISGQIIEFFEDTGLTIGNAYTPTVRMFIQGSNEILGGTIAIGSNAGATNVSVTGDVRLRNNTTSVAARNAANSADISLISTDGSNGIFIGNGNAGDVSVSAGSGHGIYLNNFVVGASYFSSAGTPALSGNFRTPNATTALASRNAANSADIALIQTDGSNNIFIGNGNANDLTFSTGAGRFIAFNKVRTAAMTPASFSADYYIVFHDSAGSGFVVPAMATTW